LLVDSLALLLVVHVALLWLLRCLCRHDSTIAALADCALCALSLAAAVWATTTASVGFGVWCLFLVQALHVALPHGRGAAGADAAADDARFRRAQRSAEAALRRLSTTH
jgi:hypothetical protein